MSLLDGFYSLFKDVNKVKNGSNPGETTEGIHSPQLPELTLEMEDEELIELSDKWERRWKPYEERIAKMQDDNEQYWLGKQFSDAQQANGKRPLVDNLVFEAVETFLPIITRQNPEPLVEADNTAEGQALANKVQKMLVSVADRVRLKLKIKKVARYWAIYLLGAAKVGWSMKENDITLSAIRPKKLILDPNSTIEDSVYTGQYIGEFKSDTAENLVARFPEKEELIREEVHGNMGTELTYLEWWTREYVFWKLKKEVLGKAKNPHWNYETETMSIDAMGQPVAVKVLGNNHFNAPKMPYIFLSVFNLGKQPHDDTSLVGQNLSMQDLINKRLQQIDKNADSTNGGMAVSGDSFTKEQAALVSEAVRKGSTIWVPQGSVNDAVQRMSAPPLPSFVYEQLLDARSETRNIFGTRGSTPAGTASEHTVRGKIITKGQDSDRLSLISDYLEQFTDEVYNWFVQLMYVYYDETHTASVLGKERALEYVALRNSDLNRKLTIGVKEGSLIPKDPLTQRNEAIDLWSAGAIDPITLYDKLEFPNPRESAMQLVTWQLIQKGVLPPQVMFPNIAMPMMPPTTAPQPGGEAPPQGEPKQEQSPDLLNKVPIQ